MRKQRVPILLQTGKRFVRELATASLPVLVDLEQDKLRTFRGGPVARVCCDGVHVATLCEALSQHEVETFS